MHDSSENIAHSIVAFDPCVALSTDLAVKLYNT